MKYNLNLFEQVFCFCFRCSWIKGLSGRKKKKRENRTTTKSISELIRKLIKRKNTGQPSLAGQLFTTRFTCIDSVSLRHFEERRKKKEKKKKTDLTALSFLFCSVPFVAHSKEPKRPYPLSCPVVYSIWPNFGGHSSVYDSTLLIIYTA